MTTQNESVHGIWRSRWIFILAATGSAVGLGNIHSCLPLDWLLPTQPR